MTSSPSSEHKPPSDQPKPNHVLVEVVTSGGVWPDSGPEEIPSHQKVRIVIEKATKALSIGDISKWVARVGDQKLNLEASFVDQGLSGHVVIDFGAVEGGGG